MLTDQDVRKLTQEIMGTAEAMGQVLSSNSAALMAVDLADFTLRQCQEALRQARLEGKGRLTLADILQQLDRLSGRPGPEEAWAMALQAKDEANTVLWTNEVAQAWSVAAPMAKGRDQVAARMAFKEAYTRITQDARNAKRAPQVEVSVGSDKHQRVEVLSRAVQNKLVPVDKALHLLQGEAVLVNGAVVALADTRPPEIAYRQDGTPYKLLPAAGSVQALLEHSAPESGGAPPEVMARIKQQLAKAKRKAANRKMAEARLARMKARHQKQDIAAAVQRYLQRNPQKTTLVLKDDNKS